MLSLLNFYMLIVIKFCFPGVETLSFVQCKLIINYVSRTHIHYFHELIIDEICLRFLYRFSCS